jgi:hypothetical protein
LCGDRATRGAKRHADTGFLLPLRCPRQLQ